MKNIIKITSLIGLTALLCFCSGSAVLAQTTPQIQTNSAANIQNNSATLNANVSDLGSSAAITIWFEWGTTTSYGNQTTQQNQGNTGSFSQSISNLNTNTTYHFRVDAQNRYGIVYGQDMTFNTNYTNNYQQVGGISVQTNSASNIASNQATLNGNLSIPYLSTSTNYVYFQWGTDTNYGNNTSQQTLSPSGSFSQFIANLYPNTTYHYRAVAQVNGSTLYGQDMTLLTFNGSNNNNNYYYGNGSLQVTKQVINLTSGNLNWQAFVNANSGDILSFAITLQANNQDIHNVMVRDVLSPNLIDLGKLAVNTNTNYGGDIISGVNIGTIYANQPVVVSYQVQVASSGSAYGTTTLNNSATVTSTERGTQTASAAVIVNNSAVNGATNVSTGLTNNPITDSFFFPIALIVLMSWLYFTGRVYQFADWLGTKIK